MQDVHLQRPTCKIILDVGGGRLKRLIYGNQQKRLIYALRRTWWIHPNLGAMRGGEQTRPRGRANLGDWPSTTAQTRSSSRYKHKSSSEQRTAMILL